MKQKFAEKVGCRWQENSDTRTWRYDLQLLEGKVRGNSGFLQIPRISGERLTADTNLYILFRIPETVQS
jgi:hypothetical protein